MARSEASEDDLEMIEPAGVLVAHPAQGLDVAGREAWDPGVTAAAPSQSRRLAGSGGFAWLATGRRLGAGRGGFWFAVRLWLFSPHFPHLFCSWPRTPRPRPPAFAHDDGRAGSGSSPVGPMVARSSTCAERVPSDR